MFFLFLNPDELASINSFGKRLMTLRKNMGLTQEELAKKIGSTRRKITYYEKETTQPPVGAVIAISKVLGVSTDVLLGLAPLAPVEQVLSPSRVREIARLETKNKKQLFQIIDAFIQADKLQKQSRDGGNDGNGDDDGDGDTVKHDFFTIKKLS